MSNYTRLVKLLTEQSCCELTSFASSVETVFLEAFQDPIVVIGKVNLKPNVRRKTVGKLLHCAKNILTMLRQNC